MGRDDSHRSPLPTMQEFIVPLGLFSSSLQQTLLQSAARVVLVAVRPAIARDGQERPLAAHPRGLLSRQGPRVPASCVQRKLQHLMTSREPRGRFPSSGACWRSECFPKSHPCSGKSDVTQVSRRDAAAAGERARAQTPPGSPSAPDSEGQKATTRYHMRMTKGFPALFAARGEGR